MDLSATGGTLAAGANTTVTVSINGSANTLNVGSYSDTVTFTNTTNGNGDTTRGVALTVNPGVRHRQPRRSPANLRRHAQAGHRHHQSVRTWRTRSPTTAPRTVPTNAGTYAVVATITDPNYTGSASSNLVIAKAAQTITSPRSLPFSTTPLPSRSTATASSGLTVSYASSNTAVATVSGNTVTIVGLGTTTITASQAGNANYNAATSVPQTLTVVRANPLAVAGGPYKVLVGQSLSLNGSASEPSYGETITTYEWDLNNDNTFGDATGATPSAISFARSRQALGHGPGPEHHPTQDHRFLRQNLDRLHHRGTGALPHLGCQRHRPPDKPTARAHGSAPTYGGTARPTSTGLPVPTRSSAAPAPRAAPSPWPARRAVNTITFNTFTGTYTLGTAAQTITLNGGITKNSGFRHGHIISPITSGAAQTWTNNSSGCAHRDRGAEQRRQPADH